MEGSGHNASVMATGLVQSFTQSLLAMAFNLMGIVAGTFIAINIDVFSLAPWAIVILPGIISVRGVIEGLFSARLSTGLHVGSIKPQFRNNTKSFYLLYYVIATLTVGASLMIGTSTSLVGTFSWGSSVTTTGAILSVTAAAMFLLMLVASPISIGVSILSFKHGLDPDIMLYPIVSTTSDVIVTSSYILVLNTFFLWAPLGTWLIWLFDAAFILFTIYSTIRRFREEEFSRTIREFVLTLMIVTAVVNVTGFGLGKISDIVGRRAEVYMLYPALIDTVGDVGSVAGSMTTTKLALGIAEPSLSSIRFHLKEIAGAWSASLILFAVYSSVPFFFGIITLNSLPGFMAKILMTNAIAVSIVILVGYASAILTYKHGLDPCHFVIPITTSFADSITTLSLLTALSVIA